MIVKCTNCNNEQEYNEDNKFCMMCGSILPSPMKKCISCNKQLPLDAKFCSSCGTKQEISSDFEPTADSKFHMGNDNMIAGDLNVVGKKEETHIEGNATIIKNEDETKQVKTCHVCGENKTILEGHNCPKCGKFTCKNCFNQEYLVCNKCTKNIEQVNESQYKEKLELFLKDGIISKNKREELKILQKQLKLSDEKAFSLEESIKKNFNVETTLTTIEKTNLKNSIELFYEQGNIEKTYSLLKPLFDKYPQYEKVLEIYLPVLLKKDIQEANEVLENISIECFSVFIAKTHIALLENKLDDAERYLNQAKNLETNNTTKYFEVLLYIHIASATKNANFLDKAYEVIETMNESQSKLDNSFRMKAILELENAKEKKSSFYKEEDIEGKNVYTAFVVEPVEVFVGEGCEYETIQSAIDDVNPNSTIYLKPGVYEENLIIEKKLNIIGCQKSIREKSSSELPIIVSDEKIGCKIKSNAKIEGIVFTNNENISFNKLNKYIHEENEMEELKHRSCLTILADSYFTNIVVIDSCGAGVVVSGCNPHLKDFCVFKCSEGMIIKNNSTGIYDNIEISNIKNSGIIVLDSSNPNISRCNIHDILSGNGEAIGITNNATGTYRTCEIFNTKIGVWCLENSNPNVIECNIHDIDGNGIQINNKTMGIYENCDISNTKDAGIVAYENSNPHVISCKIHDIPDCQGLYISDSATGKYENCEIYNTGRAGIVADENANPHVISCKIHDIPDNFGLAILASATGKYENCEIYNIEKASIVAGENSNPHVISCKIHDISDNCGLYICDSATGKYEDCEIYKTGDSIFVRDNANPHVIGCKIHDISDNCGLYICDSATGKYENCEIYKTGDSIFVQGNANPHVIGCKIHDIPDNFGLAIVASATGKYENCEIYKTGKSGIIVQDNANPHVIGCKIHDIPENSGVLLRDKASGIYENCKIYKTYEGFSVFHASPIVYGCEIFEIKTCGIYLDKAKGRYENCYIYKTELSKIIGASLFTKIINCGKY